MERDESAFVGHVACEKCGSKDNGALRASGRIHCHGCGHNTFPEDMKTSIPKDRPMSEYRLIPGEIRGLTKEYGLSEETCQKLGIRLVSYSVKLPDAEGNQIPQPKKTCIAFDYRREDGGLHGQKVRYPLGDGKKTFAFPNAGGKIPLWLMHLWPKGTARKSLIVYEGEGDAAAYHQVTKGQYPVVSIPTGAPGFEGPLRDNLQFLQSFGEVVLCFDGDDTGRQRVKEAAEFLLKAGVAVKIGEVQGHKDARSALMAGDIKAITNAFWNAERFRPEGIFRVKDLIDEARKPVQMGIAWWSPTLTKWTFGRRLGELYILGAGNSIGKTDWTTQSIAYDAMVLGLMTAVIYLEQPPVETLKRLAGKRAGKPFHIPMEEGEYTQEQLDNALDELEACPNLIFGGNFASTEWDDVEGKIRYLVASEGVQVVYLDNLSALVNEAEEQISTAKIVKEMALLCQELKIILVLLSHLSTPEGDSHEEGGKVSLKHFRGSRKMGAWPSYSFGLERNTQHPDPAMRNYSTFRVVKDRYTGRSNGNTMCLKFEQDTGQLVEVPFPAGYHAPKGKKGSEDYSFPPVQSQRDPDDAGGLSI